MRPASYVIEPERPQPSSAEVLAAAWEVHQTAGRLMMERGDYFHCEEHSPQETDAFDLAQQRISEVPATKVEGVMAKLWVALLHQPDFELPSIEALLRGEGEAVLAQAEEAPFATKLLMQAIRDLGAMQVQS